MAEMIGSTVPLSHHETLQGHAVLHKGQLTVKGRLTLTVFHLSFQPFSEAGLGPFQFLRRDILQAQPCQWPARVPYELPSQGVRVQLVNGQHFEFQVDHPALWLAQL